MDVDANDTSASPTLFPAGHSQHIYMVNIYIIKTVRNKCSIKDPCILNTYKIESFIFINSIYLYLWAQNHLIFTVSGK